MYPEPVTKYDLIEFGVVIVILMVCIAGILYSTIDLIDAVNEYILITIR